MAASPTTTRAWTYTNGLSTLSLKPSVSLPNSHELTPTQALIRIRAAALNPVDTQTMNLPQSAIGTHEKGAAYDFSGSVLAAGSSLSQIKAGDDIFGITTQARSHPAGGALSEVAVIDLAGGAVAKKPTKWSWEAAAALPLVFLTARRTIEGVAEWVDASETKKVAILGGSSATGIYTVLLAKQRGWKVVATSSGRNRDFIVNDLGADEHVDYTSTNVREGVAAAKPVAVIDCVGGTDCVGLPTSKRYVTIVGDKTSRDGMGGPYTWYDYAHPLYVAGQWFRWLRGVIGVSESYDVLILEAKDGYLEEAKTLFEDDKQLYIDSTWPFEKANEAFERLNSGRARGKVVVKIGQT